MWTPDSTQRIANRCRRSWCVSGGAVQMLAGTLPKPIELPCLRNKRNAMHFSDSKFVVAKIVGIYPDYAPDVVRTVRAFCVGDTSSQIRIVVNCGHEHDCDSESRQSTLGHLLHRPGICPSPRRSTAHRRRSPHQTRCRGSRRQTWL